uniref:Uncharacterized protein n=1 Tax=Physcomitrium patens TaxID=3218 RepID=A0A2K1KSY7_PHYPA|nr:hypothetical protein PHYPA_003863 [Physcomitrium patens]
MTMLRPWLQPSLARGMPSPPMSTPPLSTTRRNTRNRNRSFHLHSKVARRKKGSYRAPIHQTERARNRRRRSNCYTRSLLTATLVSVALTSCRSSGTGYLLEQVTYTLHTIIHNVKNQ